MNIGVVALVILVKHVHHCQRLLAGGRVVKVHQPATVHLLIKNGEILSPIPPLTSRNPVLDSRVSLQASSEGAPRLTSRLSHAMRGNRPGRPFVTTSHKPRKSPKHLRHCRRGPKHLRPGGEREPTRWTVDSERGTMAPAGTQRHRMHCPQQKRYGHLQNLFFQVITP